MLCILKVILKNTFNKFYFYPDFFSYRFIPNLKKNDVIQINQESFFQEEDLIQPSRFHISKMNKFLPNSAIFLQEFCFGKFIFNGFSH